jgi:hypothetical protein
MAFDFVILALCTFRLYTSRRSSSLAKLLFRDGIVSFFLYWLLAAHLNRFLQGYFCAAFGANLVQTVFAALKLNPVMNIIALPFALVVSVIAATTVFRNVFIAYDDFSSDTTAGASSSHHGQSSNVAFNRVQVSHGTRGATVSGRRFTRDDIPMGDFKSSPDVTGGVSIHRVVELDVERNMNVRPCTYPLRNNLLTTVRHVGNQYPLPEQNF